MATNRPSPTGTASPVMKFFANLQIGLYRWSKGRIGSRMGPMHLLLLTTIGRKSGQRHMVAIAYFKDGDNLFLVASNSGKEQHPAWYLNLSAHPDVEIEVKDARRIVHATTAGPEERARLWQQVTTEAPAYRRYEHLATREIPLVILHTGTPST